MPTLFIIWLVVGLLAGIVPHWTMSPRQQRRPLIIAVCYLICGVLGPIAWLFLGLCWLGERYLP